MTVRFTGLILAAALALSACSNVSHHDRVTVAGTAAGAIGGAVLAKLLGGNSGWVAVGTAAGAAAGALVAQNQGTRECYYSNGDNTYTRRPCNP